MSASHFVTEEELQALWEQETVKARILGWASSKGHKHLDAVVCRDKVIYRLTVNNQEPQEFPTLAQAVDEYNKH